MFKNICLCIFLFSSAALADALPPPVPALYSVHDVASNDTLNVRSKPDASGDILGEFAYNTRGIEVIGFSAHGGWAKINFKGQSGWISMNYIQAEPRPNDLLETLHCFGTEPFWSIEFEDQNLKLIDLLFQDSNSDYGPTLRAFTNMSPPPEYIDISQSIQFRWTNSGPPLLARILPGQCGDGMSDATYALHYVDSERSGCCSLSR